MAPQRECRFCRLNVQLFVLSDSQPRDTHCAIRNKASKSEGQSVTARLVGYTPVPRSF